MIEQRKIKDFVEQHLDGIDKFLIEVKVTPANNITITIDGDNGVTIDDCIELSRFVESQFDREQEDFELNVESAGVESPLKQFRQWKKNVGRRVEVVSVDGEKLIGTLAKVDDTGITVVCKEKKKEVEFELAWSSVKCGKVLVVF